MIFHGVYNHYEITQDGENYRLHRFLTVLKKYDSKVDEKTVSVEELIKFFIKEKQ